MNVHNMMRCRRNWTACRTSGYGWTPQSSAWMEGSERAIYGYYPTHYLGTCWQLFYGADRKNQRPEVAGLLPVRQVLRRLSDGKLYGRAAQPDDSHGATGDAATAIGNKSHLDVRILFNLQLALPERYQNRRGFRSVAQGGVGRRRAQRPP